MHQRSNNSVSTLKNYGNKVPQKENDNCPETKLKVLEDCDLTDREFKIFVMKKLNELKETQRGSSENSGIESLN